MKINPYLVFDNNCKEAFEFYKECLGGELVVIAVKDSPMADQMPKELQNSILHAYLKKGDLILMGSDIMDKEKSIKGNNVCLCINGGSLEELNTYFDNLSKEGQVTSALMETFFGTYGDLTDKFGVNWMFQAGNK